MNMKNVANLAAIVAHAAAGNYLSAAVNALKNRKVIISVISTVAVFLFMIVFLLVSLPGMIMQSMLPQENDDEYKALSVFANNEITAVEEEKKNIIQSILAALTSEDEEGNVITAMLKDPEPDKDEILILYSVKYGEYDSKSSLDRLRIKDITNQFLDIQGFSVAVKPFHDVVESLELDDTQKAIALNMWSMGVGYTSEDYVDGSNNGFYTGGGVVEYPLPGYERISSGFINRINPISGKAEHHLGIDIPAPTGTPVKAAESGTVAIAGFNSSYGYQVLIQHGNGMATRYGHNSKLAVRPGQIVEKGQVISYVGSTGDSTGPHLHFEVIINGKVQDPFDYLNK